MFLAVDVGNTNVTFGVFKKEDLQCSFAFKTDSIATEDNYFALLSAVMQREGIGFNDIRSAAVSSVVPQLTLLFENLILKFLKIKPLIVGPGVKTGVAIKTVNPGAVGADRIVNAVAVKHFYGTPALVVDFGTATTFDYVDEQGAYCGGVIAPGVGIALDALVTRTAKLPRIELTWPERALGNDTVPAMRSGVVLGYHALVEGLIKKIGQEVGGFKTVVATGGLGRLFCEKTDLIQHYDEFLILKGLYLISKLSHER